ncbi:MAG: hypothetical protein AAFU68_08845 [Pseudomonadota bacterium]
MRWLAYFLAATVPISAAETADCSNPAGTCSSILARECLTDLGAGVLSAETAVPQDAEEKCEAQFTRYRACLSAAIRDCGDAPRSAGSESCGPEDARQLFDALKFSTDPDELDAFAESCSEAPQAKLARLRSEKLRRERATAFADLQGDWRGECDNQRATEFRAKIEATRIKTRFTWKTPPGSAREFVEVKGDGEVSPNRDATGRYWCATVQRGRCLEFKGDFVGELPNLDFGVTRCVLQR